jgi:hypothetical protein
MLSVVMPNNLKLNIVVTIAVGPFTVYSKAQGKKLKPNTRLARFVNEKIIRIVSEPRQSNGQDRRHHFRDRHAHLFDSPGQYFCKVTVFYSVCRFQPYIQAAQLWSNPALYTVLINIAI